MTKFTKKEKQIGERALKKIIRKRNNNTAKFLVMDFNRFLKYFNPEEKTLIKKIINIDVKKEFNRHKHFFGIKPIPKNLVLINNQKYQLNGKIQKTRPQFLPKNVYLAFQKLNKAMAKEIDRRINVSSGYRSAASQMIVFLYYLHLYKWNLKKVLQRVALPGYSEHAHPQKQGIDFAPVKGIVHIDDFYKTKEYKWLKKNAKKFGFYLSFEPNNNKGTIFEPWHWHFKKNRA